MPCDSEQYYYTAFLDFSQGIILFPHADKSRSLTNLPNFWLAALRRKDLCGRFYFAHKIGFQGLHSHQVLLSYLGTWDRSRTKESADSGFCKAGLGISFAEVSCGLFNSSGSYHKMHLITGKNRCGHRENAPWFVIQRASSFDSLIIPQRIVPLQYPFM